MTAPRTAQAARPAAPQAARAAATRATKPAARRTAPQRGLADLDRLPGSEAAQVINQQVQEAERRKAAAAAAAKRRRTPSHLSTHHVGNDQVHLGNESARQMDGREEIARDSDLPTEWVRPSNLTAPDARPGFVQRWCRYKSGNTEDADNLDKMLDQGWRPRSAKSVKRGHKLTADLRGKYSEYYVKRGLILLELPERLASQRKLFYNNKLKQMTESVDRSMF